MCLDLCLHPNLDLDLYLEIVLDLDLDLSLYPHQIMAPLD